LGKAGPEVWRLRTVLRTLVAQDDAISSHISRYHVNDAVVAVLWAKVDCGPEGPTDKDWEEAADMEREVWAETREANE
jgi:hypothetical protein